MLLGCKKILCALTLPVLSLAVRAEDKIDYSKPYDQIAQQVSSFEVRHSLMPKESAEPAAAAIPPKDGAPAADGAKEATIAPKEGTLPAEPVAVRPISDAAPVSSGARPAEDFPTFGGGTELSADEAPIILKPIHLDRVERGSAYREEDGVLVPIAPAPIIDERRGGTVERPLLIGPKKPLPIVPGAGVPVLAAPAPKSSAIIVPVIETVSDGSPRAMAHVASYNTEDGAMTGAAEVEKKYPRAALFEAEIKYEYAKDRGYFHRLYFAGDRRELEYLCREMKAGGDWCLIK